MQRRASIMPCAKNTPILYPRYCIPLKVGIHCVNPIKPSLSCVHITVKRQSCTQLFELKSKKVL